MEKDNWPKIPEMIHDTTGGEIDIEGIRDNFFNEVIDFVGFNERARKVFVNKRYQDLCDPRPGQKVSTDDRFVSLWMNDHPVASSWEYRTQFNMVEVQFHLYLNQKLLVRLREDPTLLVQGRL